MISVQCVSVCVLVIFTSCVCARSLSNETDDVSLGFWWAPKGIVHHHHHHHHQPESGPWCQCHSLGCSCCDEEIISHGRRRDFHLNACLNVDWIAKANVFTVIFTVNGRNVFSTFTAVSSRDVEKCVPASSLSLPGEICFRLYKIAVKNRHMCADLIGKTVRKGKERVIKQHYGCFRVGDMAEEDADRNTAEDENAVRVLYD
ncbi:uncharacterized protein LOC128216418 [Mya arenaria]|nr:uncharacterized protein LOC128216418 [Mya arenaria]